MYGFVNHALELLVIRNYGPEVWEDIKKEAQLDEEGQFLVRIIYDDSKTYDLVAAASKVLNLNAGEILQMFGKMFFVFCQESGYDTILRVLGSNVREFLQDISKLAAESSQILLENDVSARPAELEPSLEGM